MTRDRPAFCIWLAGYLSTVVNQNLFTGRIISTLDVFGAHPLGVCGCSNGERKQGT